MIFPLFMLSKLESNRVNNSSLIESDIIPHEGMHVIPPQLRIHFLALSIFLSPPSASSPSNLNVM